MTLPNLVIAGVNKAGTTSVFAYLSRHADILPSGIKETCYFLPLFYEGETIAPIETYTQHFEKYAGQRYVMEATPAYFYGGDVIAPAIEQTLDNPRVVVMLRDPASRLFSFYRYLKSVMELEEQMTFERYVAACEKLSDAALRKHENYPYWGLKGGCYDLFMPDWIDTFGERLKVVFFEQLKTDPVGLLKGLYAWLDLEPPPEMELSVENKTRSYRNAWMHRVALRTNATLEVFLRANPGVKNAVRNLYYRFNERAQSDVMTEEMKQHLAAYYAPHTSALRSMLLAQGEEEMPSWLAEQ